MKTLKLLFALMLISSQVFASKLCLEIDTKAKQDEMIQALSYKYGYPTTVINAKNELVDNPQSREDYVLAVLSLQVKELASGELARRKSNQAYKQEFELNMEKFKELKGSK